MALTTEAPTTEAPTTEAPTKAPKRVFISYAHEPENPAHADRVLALGDLLRSQGVNAVMDLYQPHPDEGWPLWMTDQILHSDYILMVCTPDYYQRVMNLAQPGVGQGVRWEGNLIFNALYENGVIDRRFLPVLYPPSDTSCIPNPLRGFAYYHLHKGYEELYRHLTDQPFAVARSLGPLVVFPSRTLESPTPSPKISTAVNLPLPNRFFTGREAILMGLGNSLEEHRYVSLYGPPGFGKTQIATEYANRRKGDYTWLFWVNAATRESLFSGFAAIARQLNLSQQSEQDKEAVVQAVKVWMGHIHGWLLILDNADDHGLVRSFLGGDNASSGDVFPAGRESHLLLTTQHRLPTSFGTFKQIAIGEMSDNQGVELLLRYADIAPDDESTADVTEADKLAALALCREVAGHPLALAQAGAFILETASTVTEYLRLYEMEGEKLRDREYTDGDGVGAGVPPASPRESLKTIFTLALDGIRQANPLSAGLLYLCAFLAPDAIPEELFVRGDVDLGEALNRVRPGLDWVEVLATAQQYSLLSRNPQAKTVSIHRLVRDVLKDSLEPGMQKVWAERATRAVAKAFPAVEVENWTLCDRLIPHALVCKKHIVEHGFQFSEAAQMLHEAAYFLSERGQHDRALPLYELSLSIYSAAFGRFHPAVAKCLNNLGWLYLNRARTAMPDNDYVRAERYCRRALVIRRKIHGGMSHHEVAWCLHNLATIRLAQGRYDEAYLLFRKSVFIYETLYEHLRETEPLKYCNIAFSLDGMADVCCQGACHTAGDDFFRQSYLQEAEAHYQRAREIRQKHYPRPPGHPHLALSYISLSMLHHKRSDLDDAISSLSIAVEILETSVPSPDKDPLLREQRLILLGWHKERRRDGGAVVPGAASLKDAVQTIKPGGRTESSGAS